VKLAWSECPIAGKETATIFESSTISEDTSDEVMSTADLPMLLTKSSN
jgi:hypothetical protein